MTRVHRRIPVLFSLFLLVFSALSAQPVYDGTGIIVPRGTALHTFDPARRTWQTTRLQAAVNGICLDSAGALWAATSRGLACRHGSTWTTYVPANTAGTQTIPDDGIRAVLAPGSGLPALAGTHTGLLYAADDAAWVPLDPAAPVHAAGITCLFRTPDDSTAYVGTETGIFTIVPAGSGQPPATVAPDTMLPGKYVKTFFTGPGGALFCITYDYHQNRVEDMHGYLNRRTAQGWNSVPLRGIFSSSAGGMVVTRTEDVSYIYSLDDLNAAPAGSLALRITDITTAGAGTLYAGTDKGLYCITGTHHAPVAALRGRKILACGTTGGTCWCLASHGYRKTAFYYRAPAGAWKRTDGTIPCDAVLARAGKAGETWLGTDAGIITTDGTAYRYAAYLHPCVSQEITALSAVPGIVLVGTRKGLVSIRKNLRQAYYTTGLTDGAVRSVFTAPDGALWADADGWHLLRDRTWLPLNEMYSMAASGAVMNGCFSTPDSAVWLYSPEHGALNRCTGTDTVVRYTSARAVVENTGDALALAGTPLWADDTQGTWLADNDRWALARYGSDGCWYEYDYTPTRLYPLGDGSAWFCDCNRLYAVRDGRVTGYGMPPHLAPQSLLAVPGHGIWVEGKSALMHVRGHRFRVYPLPGSSGGNPSYTWTALPGDTPVTGITRCGPLYVVGSTDGLFTVDSTGIVTRLHDRPVRCVGCSGAETAWAADDHGCIRVNSEGRQQRHTIYTGLISNIITNIRQASDGTLWLLSLLGASVRRNDSWESETRFGTVSTPYIQCAAPGPDGMLLGTHKGLLMQRGTAWDIVNRAAGLPSDTVTAVCAGPDNTVWAGTPAGTVQLKKGAVIKRYSRLDCAPGSDLAAAADGSIWLLRKDDYGRGALYRFTGTGWKPRAAGWNPTCLAVGTDGNIIAGGAGGYYTLPPGF